MAKLEVLEHNTVYRNPEPNRVSEYVSFPAIAALPDDTLLCMCRHGSARESMDGRIKIHRSVDGGRTWAPTEPLPEPPAETGRLRGAGGVVAGRGGEALAWVNRRSAPGRPARSYIARSDNGGVSWSGPEPVQLEPFAGTGTASFLHALADGTLIATGEMQGDGAHIDSQAYASLVTRSTDDGRTWDPLQPAHVSAARYHFDMHVTGLDDGRVLASYWTHDMAADKGLNVHTAWSSDLGRTWTEPADAGFWGQLTPVQGLRSGRVLAVTNHRRPPLGIRALLSEDCGASFDEPGLLEIWGVEPAQVHSAAELAPRQDVVEAPLQAYHHFTFGTPAIAQLSDGVIVVAFYVTEQSVTYVRCCRMLERG